jgi:hypothetical protein
MGKVVMLRVLNAKGARDEFKITAKPFDFPAEGSLPRYEWLLGRHLLRNEVAGSAAMGGTGKSSLSIVEALAMASGKKLTHDMVPSEPLRVVLINLEDTRSTMNKRITAAMKLHKLTKEDIGDRLFVFAKGELKFKIATERMGKVIRNEKVITALTKLMLEKKGDVLSIDSFIRSHGVNENSNTLMEQVVECFEEIAAGAKCGVHLWHHTRKGKGGGDGQETTVEVARGAQAFIDACRSVRILETMSKTDARKLGVEDEKHYRRYFRVFSGKRNFAPHIENSDWFYIASVDLDNAPDSLSDGDSIGVVETWSVSEAQIEALSPETIDKIKQAVADGEWREDVRAAMWVGKAVAPILGLDPDEEQEKVRRAIKKLTKDGVLKQIGGRTHDRKPCILVVPGDWKAPVVKLNAEGAVCETCGKKLKSTRKDARFCSAKCRLKAHREEEKD